MSLSKRGELARSQALEDVQRKIREAIEFHLEGMKLERFPIPERTTLCEYVEVAIQRGGVRRFCGVIRLYREYYCGMKKARGTLD